MYYVILIATTNFTSSSPAPQILCPSKPAGSINYWRKILPKHLPNLKIRGLCTSLKYTGKSDFQPMGRGLFTFFQKSFSFLKHIQNEKPKKEKKMEKMKNQKPKEQIPKPQKQNKSIHMTYLILERKEEKSH